MAGSGTDTGVVLDFERAAMRGEPIPPGLSGVEQGEFWGLTYLYRLHRGGFLTREEAVVEKRRLLAAFRRAEEAMDFQKKLTAQMVRLWNTMGACTTAYWKERTLERGDELAKAVYGLLRRMPAAVERRDGFCYCPACRRLFEPGHAARRPRFCEDCGVELDWDREVGEWQKTLTQPN